MPGFGISAKTGSRKRFPKIDTLGREGSDPAFYRDVATTSVRPSPLSAGSTSFIRSIALALAEEIDRQAKAAGLRQRVPLEVNLGGELQ